LTCDSFPFGGLAGAADTEQFRCHPAWPPAASLSETLPASAFSLRRRQFVFSQVRQDDSRFEEEVDTRYFFYNSTEYIAAHSTRYPRYRVDAVSRPPLRSGDGARD
jgi:hypothetical protein